VRADGGVFALVGLVLDEEASLALLLCAVADGRP